jgi:hypothetical protein
MKIGSELDTVIHCSSFAHLVAEYESATGRFSAAVTKLNQRIGISPKGEYELLDRAANEARVKSEQVRLALEQHIAAHRC